MKILFYILFVCTGTYICNAQQSKLDSLLKYDSEYTSEDNTKLNILNSLAEVYEWMQIDSGLVIADRAITLAQRLNNQKELSIALLHKIRLLTFKGRKEERAELLEKVLKISTISNNKNGLAEYYLQFCRLKEGEERVHLMKKSLELFTQTNNLLGIGRSNFFLGKYICANQDTAGLQYIRKAHDIFQKLDNQNWIGFSWCEIGLQSSDSIKHDEYARKGLEIAQRDNILQVIGSAYFVLALSREYYKQYPAALDYWLKSLKISEMVGSTDRQIVVLSNIGNLFSTIQKYDVSLIYIKKAAALAEHFGTLSSQTSLSIFIGSIYQNQKKYAVALQELQRAVILSKKSQEEFRTKEAYTSLAELHLKLNNYEQSLECIKNSDSLGKGLQSLSNPGSTLITKALVVRAAPESLLRKEGISPAERSQVVVRLLLAGLQLQSNHQEGLVAISELYQRRGDTKNALYYYKKYMAVQDSLTSAANANSLTSLQIDFEVEKKEAEIALLNKDNEMQSKELDKQKVVRNAFIGGFSIMLLFAGIFLLQRNKISKEKKVSEKEKERSDALLLNILPAEVAEELKSKGTADAKHFDNVTVLFTDFISFTTVSEQLSPQELVNELHACFKGFDEICGKYNIEKIKTIGDAYLAVCGLPLADEKHAENVVKAALEIREFMANRSKELGAKTFEIRIGINSGSVVAGIVGVKKFAYDIWGDTVNTAARMEQNSAAGKINISETTYALVKHQFMCEIRGEIDAKNKGKLKMYFVQTKEILS